jgi:16S rRNA (adenine1518-N6/adenine1519-N6)-dimethyltransferase
MSTPPGARALMAALERHGVKPAKALGQNFVVDPNTIRKVVNAAGVGPSDRVLEIGAGAGSLTIALAAACKRVVAIERDPRLIPVLEDLLADADNVELIEGDALTLDLGGFGADRLVANLPYNVAATLVVRVLERAPDIAVSTVMTQREVGERLAARPGSKVYGQTSVMVRYFARAELVASISRRAFYPVPNVDSVVVRLTRMAGRVRDERERERFFSVVRTAFQQRRKTLRNSLGDLAGTPGIAEGLLRSAGIDPGLRAEDVDVEGFVAIAESFAGGSAL